VSAFTGRTPKKNVNKQYEERKEVLDMNDVVERRERCTGYCVFRVTIDEDGKETLKGEGTMNRCALCKKKYKALLYQLPHLVMRPKHALLR